MKLSEFILEVVETVRRIPRDKYVPHAIVWHSPHLQDNSVCLACLGGLYAAARNWIKPNEMLFGGGDKEASMSEEEIHTIVAVDKVRCGNWLGAQKTLGIPREEQIDLMPEDTPIPGQPEKWSFFTWPVFDEHLASLEERARQFQAIGQ